MNNPQRASKVADIYMQEKTYDLHRSRLRDIKTKPHLREYLENEASSMDQYYGQLRRYKRETKQRQSSELQHENDKLVHKLIEIEKSRYEEPAESPERHFNSYWTERRLKQHRLDENMSLVQRLISTESLVPTLKELKKSYRKNRKLSENCKRFPSIMQH